MNYLDIIQDIFLCRVINDAIEHDSIDDIDFEVSEIQESFGQQWGDLAGVMFDRDEWANSSKHGRARIFCEYIFAEYREKLQQSEL